jgi:hypothetical protein
MPFSSPFSEIYFATNTYYYLFPFFNFYKNPPCAERHPNIRLTGKGELARIVRKERSDQALSVTNAFVRLKRLLADFY